MDDPRMGLTYKRINIDGVYLNDITVDEIIDLCLRSTQNDRKTIVSYINVHAVNLAQRIPWFRDFLNSSDIVFCDGVGVKIAALLLSGRRIERFTPPDWLPILIEKSISKGITFFFLGGRPGVSEKAARKLTQSIPDFQPVGTEHGYYDKNRVSFENQELIKKINQVKPDILVVGFGMPTQEKWILENLNALDVKVVIPVGAAFDYLAGEIYRMPRWITDNGLEWLGRLLIEPERLWKRYILGNPAFFWRVFLQKIGWFHP